MNRHLKNLSVATIGAVILSACGVGTEIDIAAAQEQFCSDVEEYVVALDAYGGLFEDVELTVGDVKTAGEELEPARQAVLDSAAAFDEAVQAGSDPGVTIEIVEPETLDAVEEADAAFAEATAAIDEDTPVIEAGVQFTSAAYQLEVAWARVFADAGCIENEAEAKQWVSDYVAALQTDLAAAGYYHGEVDGIYGPQTIEAVEQLQQDAGLPVTGLVDPATQIALGAALGQQQSAEIGALQGILITTGYYSGPVDGEWSPELEDALKALQTDLGVPATGVVDAATLRAFETALAAEGEPPPTTATTERAPTTTAPTAPTTTAAAPTTTVAAPPTTVVQDGILEVLAAEGEFTQFLAAIDAAGLTETLSGPDPYTLFAPTDAAFAELAEPLPTDPDALQAFVLYHVVGGLLPAFDLEEVTFVVTAQGGAISVAVEQGFIVLNGASTVTVSNVAGSNGLAHVVNAVLIPPG